MPRRNQAPSRYPRESAASRGYNSRWSKARATFLRAHPLCVYCQQQGRQTAASVVDHIRPHKGDQALFWDKSNWQPLCASHHSAAKQSEERRGHMMGCGEDGRPLDPNHPWNRHMGEGGSKV